MGGAAIGFIWELLNINARAKWIYTVPFLEDARFFEMPLPGFFGFPPFAVGNDAVGTGRPGNRGPAVYVPVLEIIVARDRPPFPAGRTERLSQLR